ncbi:MAG: 23S rRNA (guanosine(2251)-2'-O)-methyltransferase RlmB [Verrucomicrobiales bacterium]|nr:23S rRNA (guanosine(2251)-2'-O)-methyltransferase RlmB [Verrucomicrobiales bacterium]
MPRGKRRSSNRRPNEARPNVHSASASGTLARMSEEDLYVAARSDDEILLLVLDGVQDPHNLGACLRSADGAGVTAVVVPRHKASPVTETVVRIACGAAESVPVVAAGNLARCLDTLRDDCGVKTVGTSDRATADLYETDLTGKLAIVLGAEETGMRRLTSEKCDELIAIPMAGKVECLNVSNATAVCLFEAVRQRNASI